MNDHVSAGGGGASLRGVLWLLSAGLLVLISVRAGRVGPESVAHAEMVASAGSYTAMTTASGSEELLFLIDNRSEMLMVFAVENGRAVEMVDRQALPQMFSAARAAYLGSSPMRP